MPRLEAPKGYYTATEVKKILNISDAMVRVHVQKNRIKYMVPPGRKQGFYLKKDVDKLARDLHIFLELDDDGITQFSRATKEDHKEIIQISIDLFGGGDPNSSVTSLEDRIKWTTKNPDIFYVLKKDSEVIGFIYLLPLKKGSDKLEMLLRSNFVGEVPISLDDIEEFQPGKHIDLYVVAIGIKISVRYPKKRVYAAMLISHQIGRAHV